MSPRPRMPVLSLPLVNFVHATAEVEDGAVLGDGTRIWAHAHIRRGAHVGSDCTIGEQVFVDLDVHIGDRCKVQNGGLVYRGSVVEDEVFIGPAACLTNDRRPRAATPDGGLKTDDDWTVTGVHVARGASIGAHAVVVGGVRIGCYAMVGAGAVVTRNVPDHALVFGNPARAAGWVCRCGERLADLRCPTCARRYAQSEAGLVLVHP
jgi:UDP-2-acetamido-3-amino-2,3-dideoxy-glucuronate N-acetyltransferase